MRSCWMHCREGLRQRPVLEPKRPEADAKSDGGEQLPPYWGSRDGFPLHS